MKCDLKKPACSQCIRAKGDCTGYRNFIDLQFIDNSKAVERKARVRLERERACEPSKTAVDAKRSHVDKDSNPRVDPQPTGTLDSENRLSTRYTVYDPVPRPD